MLQCAGAIEEVHVQDSDGGLQHGWQFTPSGVSNLQAGIPIGPGSLILEPRLSAPLADQTRYEHLVTLVAAGWAWRREPLKPLQRLALPPVVVPENVADEPGPKLFYSALSVPIEYLLCLRQIDELRRLGIKEGVSWADRKTYLGLLEGKPYVPSQRSRAAIAYDVEGAGRQQRQRHLQDEPRCERRRGGAALAAAAAILEDDVLEGRDVLLLL